MNKADYIVLVTVTFLSFYMVWKRQDKKKRKKFEKEILELKNAVEFAANKIGE